MMKDTSSRRSSRDVLERLIALNPCTPRKTSAKGKRLIEEIYRDIPPDRLFVAMLVVLRVRHERAGWGEDLELEEISDPGQLIIEFLKTCSVPQLKILRMIALGLEGGVEQ
jgi:hypothetical protein